MSDSPDFNTDLDRQIRAQIQALAAPTTPDATQLGAARINQAVRRRQARRRGAWLATAACLALLAAGVWLIQKPGAEPARQPVATDPDTTPQNHSKPRLPSGEWTPMAESPLSPRHSAFSLWTGTEMIVAGGLTDFACPPTADCVGDGKPSSEAAAYNPATDTWRVVADAPQALANRYEGTPQAPPTAAWTGSEAAFALDDGTTLLSYNPAKDTWRSQKLVSAASIENHSPQAVLKALSGPHILYSASQQYPGSTGDWLINLQTAERIGIPTDPFGDSEDRSMAWDGNRLWLLSMSIDNHFGAWEGTPSRLAVLEPTGWRVVDSSTPEVTYGQRIVFDGTRLLVTPSATTGHVGLWRYPEESAELGWQTIEVNGSNQPPCVVPTRTSGTGYLTGTDGSFVHNGTLSFLPDCTDTFQQADTGVWADDTLLIWGGIGAKNPQSKPLNWPVSAAGLRWQPAR